MEYLSENHLQLLLNKEWLVKIDNEKATPYLLKYYASTVDLYCCIMITDTKTVWAEVLSSKLFARRWRDCNTSHSPISSIEDEECEWRTRILELLNAAHSLGGFTDLTFDVVPSLNADLAFELGGDQFKWRWETYAQGPKVSADTLSKQLIMPLISVTHLAFSSADPVSELSDSNLEKAVDKAGKTARRTVDIHMRHAISRPRLTTTLRRMSSVFNFLPDLPPIISKVEIPDLNVPVTKSQARLETQVSRPTSPGPLPLQKQVSESTNAIEDPVSNTALSQPVDEDSVTEEEEDEEMTISPSKHKGKERATRSPSVPKGPNATSSRQSPPDIVLPEKLAKNSEPVSDSSLSSPVRPVKKIKRVETSSSSDEDSEAERKRRLARLKGGGQRGAKQPLKRGGRRF